MRFTTTLIMCLISCQLIKAQTPAIAWQNTIGGTSLDFLFTIELTPDGGSILGGHSASAISADKTEANIGSYDFWVVKLDSQGNLQWQNTIGGTLDDRLYSISLTNDGGYIMGGTSTSNISGDKTENNLGSLDYWVVKLDSLGNVEWENTLGGSSIDYLYSIQQTSDDGYILGGASTSNMSADKSENCLLGYDYWIVKLDPLGAIIWENTIGGTNNDWLKTIAQAPDGGYIVGGYSHSSISSDKTENLVGPLGSYYNDYWILKLDASGNIIWQNTIGGNKSDFFTDLKILPDGSCFVGGYSDSDIYGDKTEGNYGSYDYWVVKLNPSGTPIWDNTIGGSSSDYLRSLDVVEDGGCILGGNSNSLVSGEKTEYGRGGNDYWAIKLNNSGILDWQKTFGGSGADELYTIKEISAGNYLFSGNSLSNANYDKSENCIGNYDFWVMNVANCVQEICDGIDNDCDGLVDADDPNIFGPTWHSDADGDGYGSSIVSIITCGDPPPGYISDGSDCDDSNAFVNPGIVDIENGIDDNCDGIDNYYTAVFLKGDYLELAVNSCGAYASSESPPLGYHPNVFEYGELKLGIVCDSDMDGWDVGAPVYCGDYVIPGYAIEGWAIEINDIVYYNGISQCEGNDIPGVNSLYSVTDDSIKSVWQGILIEKNLLITQETILGKSDLYFITKITLQNVGLSEISNAYYLRTIDPDPQYAHTESMFAQFNTSNEVISNPPLSPDALVEGHGIPYGCHLGIGSRDSEARASWGNLGLLERIPSEIWAGVLPDNIIGSGVGDFNNSITFNIQTIPAGSSVVFAFAYIFSPDATEEALEATELAVCMPAVETCNSLDDNCNGLIDDGITETISITAGGPITFCQGGSVLLSATYSGASVQWKKNGTNIPGATTTTYNVTTKGNYSCVTTNACDTVESTPIFVNVIKNPNASISAGGPTTFCAGGSVILTEVAVAGCTYQWYKGATPIAGATSLTYTATTSGNYKCRVTKAATGCFKNSNAIAVSVPCKDGLPDSEAGELLENEIIVYPNPATTSITISTNNISTKTILITDALGQILYNNKSDENTINISIENLAAGMYFVKVEEGHTIYTGNFVKH